MRYYNLNIDKYDMDIIHFKDQLDFEFSSDDEIKSKFEKIYTCNGYTPQITIEGNIIHVAIDDKVYDTVNKEYQKAVSMCERGDQVHAETILEKLVEKCPLHADAFRLLAQINMGRGQYDKAINYNIEALRIDPTNLYALIAMGNLFAHQNDDENAEKYYQKVLSYHPDNMIAINNIAGNRLRSKKFDEAIEGYTKAISIDDTYVTSYTGLAMCYAEKGNVEKAFDTCLLGLKKGIDRPENPGVKAYLQKMATDFAQHIVKSTDFTIEIEKEKHDLSEMTTTPIRIETDNSLSVHARLEYAPTRNRDYHRVVYNPSKPYFAHLLMHEFMHLEMAIEASKEGKNQIVYSDNDGDVAFRKWLGPEYDKLKKALNANADELTKNLFNGLMLQVMNCPLDMLVEDRIFNSHPSMKARSYH